MSTSFVSTTSANPHPVRARRILAAHPEVRGLMGRNPWTALIAVLLVAAQLCVAAGLATIDASWPWAVVGAALFGAHVVHALYAIVHEAAHRLVFRSRAGNGLLTLLCNLPLIAPFAVALSHYHLVHHRHQGRLHRDPDLPSGWERRWFRGGPVHKLAYASLFPVLQLFREIHPDDQLRRSDGWLIVNVAVQLVATSLVVALLGWVATLYLLLSVYFWAGPHPVLFARYVQEHFVTTTDGHETHSYYGPLNHLALNVGYHVEHHDLPRIPWSRLPELTRTAPSFYDDRVRHRGWARLGLQFLFDRRVQVASRVARSASG